MAMGASMPEKNVMRRAVPCRRGAMQRTVSDWAHAQEDLCAERRCGPVVVPNLWATVKIVTMAIRKMAMDVRVSASMREPCRNLMQRDHRMACSRDVAMVWLRMASRDASMGEKSVISEALIDRSGRRRGAISIAVFALVHGRLSMRVRAATDSKTPANSVTMERWDNARKVRGWASDA